MPWPIAAVSLMAGAMFACMATVARTAETQAPLVLERTIPLPNTSGRIDHMAVDPGHGRLFVAELGNNTVDVVDVAAGRVIHRISALREPQGIGYAPGPEVIAIANAGDGSVRLYKGADFSPGPRIDLGDDADNVRFDSHFGRFLVGYGSGGLAVVDPATGAVSGRIPLPAHPEGFRADAAGQRAVINVPDAGQIVVVDLVAGRQIGTWRVPGVRANFPMAWEETTGTIAVVFRSPSRLVLLDSATGNVKDSKDTCGDADDVFFDTRRQRVYISCGSGSVDVFDGSGSTYRRLARLDTRSGARTSLFVPELDRLFVAARAGLLGSEATLLVFRPQP